ncbi:putative pentatricopeptide repeat-containing protein At3g15130 [Malania oleifera]|uniref:putative pentatricopeptide repeat-containing protein At3g15130 n=1 Tax=Malania oleifera TaxID=397392 RepID=UPI0025ADF3D3|nr:putative pentatricopeptide repeat-containing protein At3g15130 [Malania oleifera]XP_057970641.1 putative pentatricopeptide repeat-containing protein At3g15130 [Malania oleifera]
MHKAFARLWLCRSAVCWYHPCDPYLLQSFRTVYNLAKPIQRHPFENLEYKHNNFTEFFSNVPQECVGAEDFRMGLLVHGRLIKLGSNVFISSWNKLLSLCCRSGQFQYACRVFDKMPSRNVVSYNTMVSACVRNNHVLEAMHLYSNMKKEQAVPNHITLAVIIGAGDLLTASHLREAFHAQAVRYGLSSNEFVGSSLVEGYAKHIRLEEAIKAFGDIAELDLVSCNIMIDGCARNNSKEHALRIFFLMLQENMGFDAFTLTCILKTCSEPNDLNRGMQLHGCAIKFGVAQETPICNSLITMYSKCRKEMKSAMKIFREILAPNIISWTAMIGGFTQKGLNREALELYKGMLRLGVKENDFSFASILQVHSNLANLEQGRQIHARIVKSWYGLNVLVNNALMDMYSKCGSLGDAHMVFIKMGKHDVVSCATMITGFGLHGKGREALEILEESTSEGLKPNEVMFLGCLSACSHGGLVDEGVLVFRMMVDVYSVKPRVEHFSCVVDMLGRAGRLNEAERFIEVMGLESNVLVWEALLSACGLHGEIALGEKSARKIMELQPGRHGPYVSLANMYADRGLWEGKCAIREKLGVFGLKKDTGCSWIAMERF